MTDVERAAVEETDRIFAQTRFASVHRTVRLNGHAIVSQGCGHVRCVGCDGRTQYGSNDGTLTINYCPSNVRVRLVR